MLPQLEDKQIEQLKSQFIERLSKQGYDVEQEAKLKGKSGAEHSFEIMAHSNNGFISHTVAIDIAQEEGNRDVGLSKVFAFDDKSYDCGIRYKILLALPGLDSIASRFAAGQKIRVFDVKRLREFLASPIASSPKGGKKSGWESKEQLMKSLLDLGYSVEEKGKAVGNSGVEYTFDILATFDNGLIAYRLGMDIMAGDMVNLQQISLFDNKTYDTGIQEKALLVTSNLHPDARQLAEQQRVHIIDLPLKEKKPSEKIIKAKTSSIQNTVDDLLTSVPEVRPKVKSIKRKSQLEALQLIPETMARRFAAVPLSITDNVLQVAMVNPSDIFALEALAAQSQTRISPIAASEKEIIEMIDFNYRGFGDIEAQISRMPGSGTSSSISDEQVLLEAARDTPVASALRLIIDEAAKARASDIHIEPEEDRLRIRYRIDGAL
jgi:general secretion pathway protein E